MYVTSWENKEEVVHLGIDVNSILKILMSEKILLIREVYDKAFNAYLDQEYDDLTNLMYIHN